MSSPGFQSDSKSIFRVTAWVGASSAVIEEHFRRILPEQDPDVPFADVRTGLTGPKPVLNRKKTR